MSAVQDSSLAVLALTNRLVDAGVDPLTAPELWRVLDAVGEPSTLLGRDAGAIAVDLAGDVATAERVATLLDTGITIDVRVDDLQQHGVWVLTAFDEGYPARLRERLTRAAPPVLYGVGDQGLLSQDGIGVVGSRDVDEEGAEVARDMARAAVRRRLPLISGGARGVDQLSMAAAAEAGGQVVGVLAESLQKRAMQADVRRAVLEGAVCLCTPYRPDLGFSAGRAMGRNKVIYGLSRATLVVASARDKGGTWAGATEAIKKRYATVAVWRGPGEGDGNAALERAGGVPVSDVDAVLELDVLTEGHAGEPVATQLALGDAVNVAEEVVPATASNEDGPFTAEGAPELSIDTADDEPVVTTPLPASADVITPTPTGVCWCGCGNSVPEGKFFVPGHRDRAAREAAKRHFGSVEAFLLTFGDRATHQNGASR